ncbi:Acetylornithine/succinyldiaminopimelate aminotransferase [Flexistipes sinusarabici DSM 4947]|uniref:Acetylornithine aminotransferase n=2 Tax=Flexistipes sinusarabici TaxID=2352 RepID=F8E559_FLESM|nr:aspartate aminotransferase family protein [Flexistipes sinusarabici]AEI15695.1 Acetylornithine/succinyldiaminopimelate aminotransferase [Flexistipes sinusarabici DSM 4947]
MGGIMNTYNRMPVSFDSGSGCYLYDENGEKYIDFTSGIAVVNLGHANKDISKVVCDQSSRLIHTSNLFENKLQQKVAERLSELSFGGDVFFCNSGAEANEAAIKLARIYGNKKYEGIRYKIITMEDSFHGRSYATLSATGQDKVKDGFRPVADFFKHVPFGDFEAIRTLADNGDVVAVMLEVIQGEGGVKVAGKGFLKQLRDYCDKEDILLIFDEVQTGMGRTGNMFAYEHYNIKPDIMTLAKALANGVPIGATVASEKVSTYFKPGTHATTFGGNYLACAAANKVLDIMTEEGFIEKVRQNGAYLQKELENLFGKKAEIRGEGLMVGASLKGMEAAEFIQAAADNKLLLVPAGDNTVRFYPPLNTAKDDLDYGLGLAEKTLKDLSED